MRRAVLVLMVGATLGCAPVSPSAAGARAIEAAPPSSHAPLAPEPSASPALGAANVASSEPAPLIELPFTFTRVHATPVSSLAVGKPPKVAALSTGEALVFDGAGVTRLAAPEAGAPGLAVEIFFGRDDQPRLMGYRSAPAGAASSVPYYRRYKAGRFRPEPGELGPLAGPDGALYGVLGHADPEVVCRPQQFCLVKRVSGWGRAPAHAEPVRVLLAGDTAWALHRERIERLERDAWVALAPERVWNEPSALFVDAGGTPWVVEAGRDAVTRLVKGRWQTTSVPLREPRGIAGTTAEDVWLVGKGGAAHFDGKAWREVPGVSGPLALVAYSSPELWLAGEAGVFRGVPTKHE